MRSRRPYLLRAMYEWMADTRQTPHILVDARQDGVVVPQASVHEGRIVLNIGASAAHRLVLGNEQVEFDARFGGVSHHVVVPLAAVLAVYARETGQGMMFGLEDGEPVEAPAAAGEGFEPDDPPPVASAPSASKKGRAKLKVVK
jgi:stringent starvation protein B